MRRRPRNFLLLKLLAESWKMNLPHAGSLDWDHGIFIVEAHVVRWHVKYVCGGKSKVCFCNGWFLILTPVRGWAFVSTTHCKCPQFQKAASSYQTLSFQKPFGIILIESKMDKCQTKREDFVIGLLAFCLVKKRTDIATKKNLSAKKVGITWHVGEVNIVSTRWRSQSMETRVFFSRWKLWVQRWGWRFFFSAFRTEAKRYCRWGRSISVGGFGLDGLDGCQAMVDMHFHLWDTPGLCEEDPDNSGPLKRV